MTDNSGERPKVFLGAARESNELLHGLAACLKKEKRLLVRGWEEVFDAAPNGTTLDVLLATARTYDFAAFLLSADDVTVLRDRDVRTTRSNTVFEAGLFIGALGHDRVFLFVADDWSADVPTDLAGVLVKKWDADDPDPQSAFSTPAHQCVVIMRKLGVLIRASESRPAGSGPTGLAESLAGTAEVWQAAARAGVLVPPNVGRLAVGALVVHPSFGLGRVAEVGPSIVTVEFEAGQLSEVRFDRLFMARFPDT